MTRARGELPDEEEALLGIERPSIEDEEDTQRRHEQDQQLRKDYLTHLMGQDMFREWLWSQLQAFGAFDNAFGVSPNGFADPMATQFKLGMKAAGWALWEQFDNLTPDLASLMRREAAGPKG